MKDTVKFLTSGWAVELLPVKTLKEALTSYSWIHYIYTSVSKVQEKICRIKFVMKLFWGWWNTCRFDAFCNNYFATGLPSAVWFLFMVIYPISFTDTFLVHFTPNPFSLFKVVIIYLLLALIWWVCYSTHLIISLSFYCLWMMRYILTLQLKLIWKIVFIADYFYIHFWTIIHVLLVKILCHGYTSKSLV